MSFSPERLQHLEFIQATIARQAGHSFAFKGWSITVAGALYAYTASNLSCGLALVVLLPPFAFAWLDLYYLRQERLFRQLYVDAIRSANTLPVFVMDPKRYHRRKDLPDCSFPRVMRSASWWVLHLTIVSVGVILLIVAIVQ